jgi:lysylphosphatidylglycerol synthetase-like protein (DUF2156 family)
MSATFYAPHDNHGVTVGQDMAVNAADEWVGVNYRMGLPMLAYTFNDRDLTPIQVVALAPRGHVTAFIEYA